MSDVTLDAQKAELVKLRYFVGLTTEQAARVLNISEPTAKRWWAYAKAWLYQACRESGDIPMGATGNPQPGKGS